MLNINLKTTFKVIAISGMIAANAFFISCSKEDDLKKNPGKNITATEISQEGIKSVPFFEVAKGDSISKGIFRDKPITNGNDDVVVLYSSESNLKAVGASGGTGYIYNLKTSVRSGNSAPATIDGYTKIPVDLNEGAGGKYIYLYYLKGSDADHALCYINIRTSSTPFIFTSFPYINTLGTSFGSGGWTDLNQGAGGHFIVMEGCSKNNIDSWLHDILSNAWWYPQDQRPIKDILIISSSKGLSSYPGWILINVDLNRGAGGKYIYLCYKK